MTVGLCVMVQSNRIGSKVNSITKAVRSCSYPMP